MIKRGIKAAVLAAVLCTAASVPVFAAQAAPAAPAKDVAEKYVPAGSSYIKTEEDAQWMEVQFYNQSKKETYELDVSKASATVVSFDSERWDSEGSAVVALTSEQAKAALLKEIPTAQIEHIFLQEDDGRYEFRVLFHTAAYYGYYTIHPQNGTVLSRDITMGQQPTGQQAQGLLSYEKIISLSQAKVPGGVVTDVDLDRENASYFYKVEMQANGQEYDLIWNAKTGELIGSRIHAADTYQPPASHAPVASQEIGMAKAQQIALARVPGAVVQECERSMEDGRLVYEGELSKGNWQYEFEIDAATGQILQWEAEYDD